MESSSLKVTRRVQRPVLEAVSLVESGRVSLICPRVFLAKINLWEILHNALRQRLEVHVLPP
jgi:hypothetical protein